MTCVRCDKKLPLYMRKKKSSCKSKNENEPARYAYSKDETCACVLPIENGDGTCWECNKMLPEYREDANPRAAFKYEDYVPSTCECAEDRARFGTGVTCVKCQWPCPACPAWNFKTDTECAGCMMPLSYYNGNNSSRDAHDPNRNKAPIETFPALAKLKFVACLHCSAPNQTGQTCARCRKALVYHVSFPPSDEKRRKQPAVRFEDDDDDAMLQLALRLSLEESLNKQQDTYLSNFIEEALVLVPHEQTARALSTVGFQVAPVGAMSRSTARRMIVWAYYKDPAAHIHCERMPRDVVARILLAANLATVYMVNKWMKQLL